MKAQIYLSFVFLLFFFSQNTEAQIPNCDTLVPVFNIDFASAISDSTWISSPVSRNGNCCGTIPPDRCVLFVITVGSNTVALTFNVFCSLPSGSIYYQVNCGTPMLYGDTTFISTPGVYYLTYCKPGNQVCTYSIASIAPQIPTDIREASNGPLTLMQDVAGNHFLNLDLLFSSSFTLNIFSADGRIVSEKNYELTAGRQSIPLSTQELADGIYFVQLSSAGSSVTKKLVIAR